MSPIFAQMRGDSIRSGGFGDQRGFDWIGFDRAASLTDRSDVVDVDVETHIKFGGKDEINVSCAAGHGVGRVRKDGACS